MRSMAGAFDQKAASDNCPDYPLKQAVDKKSLRKEITLRRDSLSPDIRKIKDQAAYARLTSLNEYKKAGTILLYASFRSEVNTESLIRQALADNRIVVLPRCDQSDETLKLFAIRKWSDLVPGCWGILEPLEATDRAIDIRSVDIVIAPGVAFDEDCNRLGYGKGYYDKLLSKRESLAGAPLRPLVVGLAYEEQIVPSIPCSPHDMKMDFVITDKRNIYCHGSKQD